MSTHAILATASLLILTLAAELQPAEADPITMNLSAGGSGGCIGCPNVSESMTGTFEFEPTTDTVFNVLLQGNEIVNGSVLFSESWAFGPVSGVPVGSFDVFSLAGKVGSLGDVLEFSIVVAPDGGFVPASGSGAIRSGSPATSGLNELDNWGGTISPIPEPPGFLLVGSAAFVVLLVLVYRKRFRRVAWREWPDPLR